MWSDSYRSNLLISYDEWVRSDKQTFSDAFKESPELASDPSRIYSDFFVPRATADILVESLEALGFVVLYLGANCDPTFVHARWEGVWSLELLLELSQRLADLAQVLHAAYDGTFIISVAEDDPD